MKATLIPSLCAGTELDIVNAARKSFNNKHENLTPRDKSLLAFLHREKHLLPFRHPQLSFECEAPVFVARQLGKHQTGMSWSEVSRRYKTGGMAFWTPSEVRRAPDNAKQGTGSPFDPEASQKLCEAFQKTNTSLYNTYLELLEAGVAPEQARAVLPQSMYVYWTWTGSLLAWLHLIKERNHPNAQTETRQFVMDNIAPVVKGKFPLVYGELMTSLGPTEAERICIEIYQQFDKTEIVNTTYVMQEAWEIGKNLIKE